MLRRSSYRQATRLALTSSERVRVNQATTLCQLEMVTLSSITVSEKLTQVKCVCVCVCVCVVCCLATQISKTHIS